MDRLPKIPMPSGRMTRNQRRLSEQHQNPVEQGNDTSAPSAPGPSRRTSSNRDQTQVVQSDNNSDFSAPSKKRKGSLRSEDDEPSGGTSTSNEVKKLAGPKASRNRLLSLLDRHVQKKKHVSNPSRTTIAQPSNPSQTTITQPSNSSQTTITQPSNPEVQAPIIQSPPSIPQTSSPHAESSCQEQCQEKVDVVEEEQEFSSSKVDYSRFDVTDLQQMVLEVGLDSKGMDKDELIRNCRIYQDLIILPNRPTSTEEIIKVGSSNSNTQDSQELPTSFSPLIHQPLEDDATANSELHQSSYSTAGPRNSNTRHSPEILVDDLSDRSMPPSSSKRRNKGKGRARVQIEDDSDQEAPFTAFKGKTKKTRGRVSPSANSGEDLGQPDGNNTSGGMDADLDNNSGMEEKMDTDFNNNSGGMDNGDKISYSELKKLLLITNNKVELLTDEYHTLARVVKDLVDANGNKGAKKTARGGRTAVHIRFHIDAMLGRTSETNPLPPPAASQEKDRWMYEKDLEDVEFDLENLPKPPDDHNPIDPHFPYPDGPGHPDATPQQLAVMWKLMNAVGMESFRPDFSQSAQSPENKWVWGIAEKIFIKLVECGEYPGVSLDRTNREYIKECFDSHFQTLKKRHRTEQWETERKIAAGVANRRVTRLERLKKARRKTVMDTQKLWRLLPLIETTCSDDETDTEGISITSSPGESTATIVRALPWRSEGLSNVWKRLEDSQVRLKQSLAPKTSSPNRGRPSRPRLRRPNAPPSKIVAPKNLPKDCYAQPYLERLSSNEKALLHIDEKPILLEILAVLDELNY
ncbi:uncharacterized protein MELLADRAFT_84683 [Melampsora larici-populina 98AG31]|uniref:Uncharacterized protein n=1 Tax=Melampsora larici-populina (strain 98AG31 / pathotype 3-4-7) TaxID=747676 RepID=F4RGG5_MELLP|nr:uncharacterized protein MELLADRAFT_84683 [Melampsora larici-populina 98AG31]EGG08654.1 hypothetical protein MELLADRAFT_84683 [Melampsora larici-populina 98AG31]